MTIRAKVDNAGESVHVLEDGETRVDGIFAFRRVLRDGVIMIQFFDKDRQRSICRGTPFVEVPLVVLIAMMEVKTEV